MKCLAQGIVVGFAAAMFAASANASVIVLDFTGLQDQEAVGEFYNGGTSTSGTVGPSYGISFTGFEACGAPGGSCTAVINEPSPPNVAQISPTATATMAVAGGFTTGFSLFYTDISAAASFDVLDIDGNSLGSVDLPLTPEGPPDTRYSNWLAAGLTFSGTAYSVKFISDGPDLISFDNITVGAATPVGTPGGVDVPEPFTLSLFGAGLAGMAASRRRKKA